MEDLEYGIDRPDTELWRGGQSGRPNAGQWDR